MHGDLDQALESPASQEIHSDLVETLFDTRGSFIVALIGGILPPAAAWFMTGEDVFLRLSVLLAILAVFRVAIWSWHQSRPLPERRRDARRWETLYAAGAIGFVTTVGVSTAVIFSAFRGGPLFIFANTIMLAGVGALSGRNAGAPKIVFLQLLGLCGPLIAVTLVDRDPQYRILTVILVLEVISIRSTTVFLHKNLEAALRNGYEAVFQRKMFSIALNNMTHGLCMGDSLQITVVNRRMKQLFKLEELATPISLEALAAAIGRSSELSDVDIGRFAESWKMHALDPHAREFSHQSRDRIFEFRCEAAEAGRFVTVIEDVTARRQAVSKIEHIAHHNALTGLPNRLQFKNRLERELKRIEQHGRQLAVLSVDLDRFKEVNDTLGHSVGDSLLRAVAQTLLQAVQPADLVARFGGDEFCILLDAARSQSEANEVAQRILDGVKKPYFIDGHTILIGASIGLALAPEDASSAEGLLKCADLAMYNAKAEGHCVALWFTQAMEEALIAKRRIEAELRRALGAEELMAFYQPIVDARTQRVTACEALVRWAHPIRGLVSPAEFIPVAEETGLIVALGEWMLRHACRDAASWSSEVRVAVNLSPKQFQQPNLLDVVKAALAETGLPPQRLELEITESILMLDTDDVSFKVKALNALGVHLSLDDFGTGFSSLNYLNRFPVRKLKIDRSFVKEIDLSPKTQAIVEAIALLARKLEIDVVAEGVETNAQLACLATREIFLIQGYLFSPPMPLTDLAPAFSPMEGRLERRA
ncbi:MAG: EAL domain-containing protein [Methylocystis sp.]